MAEITEKQWLSNIKAGLVSELTSNEKALPQGFNRERFTLNCITVITDMLKDNRKKKELQAVNPESIPIVLAKGAYLGLDFFNGECYAIPYGGNLQFQTDYKGEIKLCKKWSKNPIKDIYAKNVREEDFFEEVITDGEQSVNFKPVPFSNKKIIGSFAVVLFKDGSMMYDTMSAEEIEAVRNNYSKAKNSDAWTKSTGEMYKKTVLRRLCKLIDLDFDDIKQQTAYIDGGDVEFVNGNPVILDGRKPTAALPDNGAPMDVFAQMAQQPQKEPVPAQAQQPQQEQKAKQEKKPQDAPTEQQTIPEDFAQFEQQYAEQQPPVSPDFEIPDEMMDGLPFK